YDQHFNARSSNAYHHKNAREMAALQIGVWFDLGGGADGCWNLGMALHYMTDLAMPMHVANVIGPLHADIEKNLSAHQTSYMASGRYSSSSGGILNFTGKVVWPPNVDDTPDGIITDMANTVWGPGAASGVQDSANPYGLTWGMD